MPQDQSSASVRTDSVKTGQGTWGEGGRDQRYKASWEPVFITCMHWGDGGMTDQATDGFHAVT